MTAKVNDTVTPAITPDPRPPPLPAGVPADALLAALVQSSDDAIVSKTLDGTITSWNPGAERLFGYTAAEAVGRNITLIVPDDRLPEEQSILSRLRAGRRIGRFETLRRTKDGRQIAISVTVSPLHDAEGRVIGASKIARELTEIEHQLHLRRQAEDRLAAVLSGIEDPLVSFDTEWRYAYVNAAAARALGAEPGALIGRRLGEPGTERLIGAVEIAELHEVAREGRPRATVGRHRATGRWYEHHLYPSGEGLTLFASDITEQRLQQEALKLAMRAGRMGAWSRDIPSNAVWWSAELEALFGLPPGGFPGLEPDFFALVHPEDRAAVAAAVEQAIATRGDYAVQFRFRHADGHWGWMEGRGRADYDEQGRATTLHGLGIDVSERRRIEDELRRLNDELSDADRRKDEFLATLAHELRNPLAPVRTMLHVLQRRLAGEPVHAPALEVMDRQLRQLTRLVDDLLDLRRIAGGKVEIRLERVLLAEVVAAAVEAATPAIEAGRHRLVVTLPPAPVELQADPTRIAQILLNLLNNAAKYTPDGGAITLAARLAGDEVEVAVQDDGIGIATADLARIFEMFSQVVPALQRSRGGLGIGLALARGLAELHHGRIVATSAGPGRGSRFVLHLPQAPALGAEAPTAMLAATPASRTTRADPAAAALPSAPALSHPARGTSRPRVLVADDNADAAASLALLLELGGCEVRTAGDGAAALQIAESFRPDAALLDIGMPILNGCQVAERLRAEPWGATMRLVALTGWGTGEDRRRTQAAGFDAHATKPIDGTELQALLWPASTAAGTAGPPD